MLEYNTITLEKLAALANDLEITAIINGEYYTVIPGEIPTDNTTAFIEGVKFAAAAIEDYRARMNLIFQANDARNPKTTKRAIACNEARNKETKNEVHFLLHIIKPEAGFDTWQQEYHNGKLWKLEG